MATSASRRDPPHTSATIAAVFNRRQQDEAQPLPAALVEPLRTWLAGFPAGERVFARIAGGTARMPRSDLKAGRRAWLDAAADESERKQREEHDFLKYADHQGEVADFHAIRVIYVSRVTAAGASVKDAQTLARHSSPVLTMNVYARTSLRAMAPAVRGLGELVTQRPVAAGGDRCPTHLAQPDEVDLHPGVDAEVAQAGTNRPREASTPRRGVKEHEPASAEKTSLSTNKTKRRARDSNPQPISRHLISSQTASRSLTLRGRV